MPSQIKYKVPNFLSLSHEEKILEQFNSKSHVSGLQALQLEDVFFRFVYLWLSVYTLESSITKKLKQV